MVSPFIPGSVCCEGVVDNVEPPAVRLALDDLGGPAGQVYQTAARSSTNQAPVRSDKGQVAGLDDALQLQAKLSAQGQQTLQRSPDGFNPRSYLARLLHQRSTGLIERHQGLQITGGKGLDKQLIDFFWSSGGHGRVPPLIRRCTQTGASPLSGRITCSYVEL